MIDSNEINAAIQAKLAEAVAEQVANLFKNDEQLKASLRSQAVSLLVRNFNLDALVKQGMASDVSAKVAELLVSEENTLLDGAVINNAIAANVASATDKHIASIINNDPALLGRIKAQAISSLVRQISLDNNVEAIIANKIAEQFAAQFDGVAIHNEATKRELTIMDDNVVVENTMTSTNVTVVDHLGTKDATINGKLVINGRVDTSTSAWDGLASKINTMVTNDVTTVVKKEMIDAVMAQANTINFTKITLNGEPALTGSTLGAQITDSSLSTVGTLKGLTVEGPSTVDALHVEHKRVGINTKTPNSALDIWDDDVEIIAGKLRAQTAYIGTNRTQDLVLGVNRSEDLTIDKTGVTTIKKLKLGIRTIVHGGSIPGYAGTPGDIVLNTKLTVDNPVFAWYCLHDYSWIPLKATI